MSSKPVVRVARVRFTPQGKAYATRCDRKDIGVGDWVEVLMHAGSEEEFSMDGVVTEILHERWACSCRVLNLTSEVEYSIGTDGMLSREVKANPAQSAISLDSWRARKQKYQDRLPDSSRSELRRIYEDMSNGDGEATYLSDGVWITPSGDLEDRGR